LSADACAAIFLQLLFDKYLTDINKHDNARIVKRGEQFQSKHGTMYAKWVANSLLKVIYAIRAGTRACPYCNIYLGSHFADSFQNGILC
jgi:hypothetical protein